MEFNINIISHKLLTCQYNTYILLHVKYIRKTTRVEVLYTTNEKKKNEYDFHNFNIVNDNCYAENLRALIPTSTYVLLI